MTFFFSFFLGRSHNSFQEENAVFLCHTQETSGGEGDEIKYKKQTYYFKLQRQNWNLDPRLIHIRFASNRNVDLI